ncbi:hypothetical protein JCM6882_000796 [Rhodosporidiobolus microsporus]
MDQTGAAVPPPPGKTRRSQFIEKLHDLLENPGDPDSLRWTPDGHSFEITSNEGKARAALAPKWDFRSLSSFIRQLSYYNFKRLSDRRRSTERRASNTGFIVFTHPTGFFVRGDNSQLDGITRKTRSRPEKTRKSSAVSNNSAEDDGPAGLDWAPATTYSSYQPPGVGPSSFTSPFGYAQQPQPTYQPPVVPQGDYSGWRSYTSPSWPGQQLAPGAAATTSFSYGQTQPLASPTYEQPEPAYHALRRTSLSDFKVGISPRSKPDDLPPVSTSSYHPISAFASQQASSSSSAHPNNDAAFHSPYPTPSYPSHLGTSGAFEQPHYNPDSAAAASASTSSYRPTGLAMFNPRGSVSGDAGGAGPSTSAAPTYSPYPAPSLPPSLSLLPPHLHHPHPQHPNEVLPSPTYSSEDEPPPLPLHGHGQGQYDASRTAAAHLAPLGGGGMYAFPSSSGGASTAGPSATQQSYLQHSGQAQAQSQTQAQLQGRSPLYHPSSSSSSAHPHPLSQQHHQQHQPGSSVFLPPAASSASTATPSPLQPHAHLQGYHVGGGNGQKGSTSATLGWAPPAPAGAGNAGGGGGAGWGETG